MLSFYKISRPSLTSSASSWLFELGHVCITKYFCSSTPYLYLCSQWHCQRLKSWIEFVLGKIFKSHFFRCPLYKRLDNWLALGPTIIWGYIKYSIGTQFSLQNMLSHSFSCVSKPFGSLSSGDFISILTDFSRQSVALCCGGRCLYWISRSDSIPTQYRLMQLQPLLAFLITHLHKLN